MSGARRPLARQNPDLFRGFLKTYLAAIKIIHEEPAITKRALARFLTKDPEMIDDSYRRLEALFLKVPYMPEEAIRAFQDHGRIAGANMAGRDVAYDGLLENRRRYLHARAAVHRGDAWRFEGISSARSRRADDVDLLLRQHFHQTRSRRSQRIRVRRDSRRRNAITGARYRSLRHNRVTGDRPRVHSRH